MSQFTEFEIGYVLDPVERTAEYTAAANWCNENQTATIEEEKGQYIIVTIPDPTQEEINTQKVAQIDSQLATLDAKSIRSLRASVNGTATAQDTQIIADIEVEMQKLREERAKLVPASNFNL